MKKKINKAPLASPMDVMEFPPLFLFSRAVLANKESLAKITRFLQAEDANRYGMSGAEEATAIGVMAVAAVHRWRATVVKGGECPTEKRKTKRK